MVSSVYLHIPFCSSKCHYCSFVSFCKLDLKKDYLKALSDEIKGSYENEKLRTLYFGGGTPSLLSVAELDGLLRHFNVDANTEITMEGNPDDISYSYLRGIYDLGINRLSLGCQTFDDNILKLINRRHNAGQVVDAVKMAQGIGFKNISLDFIYGLPNQTLESFISDLKRAVALGVQHISLYGLKIDEGCYFYKNMPENLADDDLQADMYVSAVETLTDLGFEHYEVSNFSKRGFNSKHNLTYWQNEEYYGFGVSAHGYKDGVRYGNLEIIEDYIKSPIKSKESKILTLQEKLEEEIFLGLRKLSGINVSLINQKYSIDFEDKYKEILRKYEALNLLKRTKTGYALTLEGVLVSNVILADFIE